MHYLHNRNGVYYYRQRLPKEYGNHHINKSLRTKDYAKAKHLLKLISYNVSLFFNSYRNSMLQNNIQSIINMYITEAIDTFEEQQATKVYNYPEERFDEEELANELLARDKGDLYINNQRLAEVFLQDILSTNEDLEAPTD